jgi:dienelactone hydrolase
MRHAIRVVFLAVVLVGGAGPRAARGLEPAGPAAPTGIAAFSNHARFVDAKISPKGTWLAAISEEGGRRSLTFVNLADRKLGWELKPGGYAVVGDVAWANDTRVVVELWDQDGTLAGPVSRGELLAVNADGSTGKLIFGYRAGEMQTGSHIQRGERERGWAQVVARLPKDDRRILIGIRSWRDVGDRMVRLAALDVYTGVKSDVAVSPVPETDFLTDQDGRPRVAWTMDEQVKRKVFYRDPVQGWRDLAELKGVTPVSVPRGFVSEDMSLELVDPVEAGWGLFALDLGTGERRMLGRTKLVPPGRIVRDMKTWRAIAFESDPDLPDWQIVDPKHPVSRLIEGLLEGYPGQHVSVVDQTEDGRLAVVMIRSDRNPGQILLADTARRTVQPLLDARPWIDPEAMAEMSAFHIKASDGLLIHGYVTYPRDVPAGTKAPLVVLPHGGPFGVRDHWGFNPEVQLLASHGFAVLQVNYRGSGGYGDAYREAGYRHWGDRIVGDIVDATRWLVKKGQVDGDRACIYGASFGGYAALQATIVAPGLFRCAVGYAGVYDLTKLEHNDDIVTSQRARGYVRTTAGSDEAELEAASPALHADQIKVPVLLIHGGRDRRVPIAHAEKLRKALTRLGRPPEWLEEPSEGHGFYDEGARERLYTRLVAFLKAHTAAVPGGGPAAPSPAAAPGPAP